MFSNKFLIQTKIQIFNLKVIYNPFPAVKSKKIADLAYDHRRQKMKIAKICTKWLKNDGTQGPPVVCFFFFLLLEFIKELITLTIHVLSLLCDVATSE